MELGEIGRAAVARHDAAVAAVVGFAHGRVHADLGRHAADEQRVDAAVAQQRVQIGRVERALARLVDDGLAGDRRQRGDDVVARLAANQDAAHRARRADAQRRRAALDLRARRVGEVGAMALARVDDQHAAARARASSSARHGATAACEQRHVVAERLAEPAGLEEIALHVDDHERRRARIDRDRFGLGVDQHVGASRCGRSSAGTVAIGKRYRRERAVRFARNKPCADGVRSQRATRRRFKRLLRAHALSPAANAAANAAPIECARSLLVRVVALARMRGEPQVAAWNAPCFVIDGATSRRGATDAEARPR